MELNSRELATLILVSTLFLLLLLTAKNRGEIGRSMLDVLRALKPWKVWLILLLFALYAVTVVFLAWILGLWTPVHLKDTVIVVLFTGFPVLMATTSKRSGGQLVKYVVLEVLGATALLVAYLNLAPLPLGAELLLQLILLILVVCGAFALSDPKHSSAAKFFNSLLAIIGIFLLIYTSFRVVSEFDFYDWNLEVATFALSVWLPLSFLLVLYPLGFIAACESVVTRLKFFNQGQKLPRRVRFALVWGFHGSLRYASRFTGQWNALIAKSTTFRSASRVMREYRLAVRGAEVAKKQQVQHVKAATGVVGVDDEGYWLDRREFDETKEVLETVAMIQLGYSRNHKSKFTAEPEALLLNFQLKKLPEPHGLMTAVAKDRKSWATWRRTAGGLYLGIGGSAANAAEWWRFADTQPPAGLPTTGATGWGVASRDNEPGEWLRSDRPLPDVLAPTLYDEHGF